ncbi:hypothetical protein GCM10012279_04160 [Micromonospora yangpuensis]|uniref:Secreted protein n=1 Tax=Micromonospora yangpuensis TaxID=683228 RepID=A0A1C6U8B5_9ACTN|nr:hypothetical protein GCM10012279_04160 [Micromonospora yangpuensis]SCL50173.1 hypothetical protein GA0070617_1401 [Micromonospora yangpuensis]
MRSTEQRLAEIRGGVPPRRHNARTIAALTGNPGCTRRAVLDSAGVDKTGLAQQVGFPARFGQSRFAITRGNAFEAQLKADGGTELLRLVAERLGVPVPAETSWTDLGDGSDGQPDRHRRSRARLLAAVGPSTVGPSAVGPSAAGPSAVGLSASARDDETVGPGPAADAALFDHPLLALEVAGQRVHLEPDLVAARLAGRWHVVEIKSFPVIDGQADPAKVAAAAIQSAVYVLALRDLLTAAGHPAELVSTDVVLICPRDFGNQPVASLVDVRKQLLVLRRQLDRMERIDTLLAGVPADFTADPAADPATVTAALRRVDARYAPECLASCELAYFCRHETRGQTGSLGRPVREALGGVATVEEVLALAAGERTAEPDQAEAAALLRAAARLRADALSVPSPGDTLPAPSPGDTLPAPSPGDTLPAPSPGDTVAPQSPRAAAPVPPGDAAAPVPPGDAVAPHPA